MVVFYRIAIGIYGALIRCAALWSAKARKWIRGRKEWRKNTPDLSDDHVIWMHCASLGEFEQGKPVLNALSEKFPDSKVVVTFFSPSGYEHSQDYKGADLITYLPLDTPRNARDFIARISPDISLFVKYELWYHFLKELDRDGSKTYLVSANFRPGHACFKWYGGIFRKMLKTFDWIFVQNKRSKELLEKIGRMEVTVSGDTRFDRVMSTVDAAADLPLINRFKNNQTLVVGGSTWPPEEKIMAEVYAMGLNAKWVIAPHNISDNHIKQIEAKFGPNTVRYSEVRDDQESANEADVLIIDNIGLLSRIYKYADLSVIGGGFSGSLHNILEAAAFGSPVMFGPKHDKFPEAQELIDAGGAATITVKRGIVSLKEMIENDEERKRFSEAAKNYVESNAGASKLVVDRIIEDQN